MLETESASADTLDNDSSGSSSGRIDEEELEDALASDPSTLFVERVEDSESSRDLLGND